MRFADFNAQIFWINPVKISAERKIDWRFNIETYSATTIVKSISWSYLVARDVKFAVIFHSFSFLSQIAKTCKRLPSSKILTSSMSADKLLMFREANVKPRFTGIWLSVIDLTGNVWLQLGWWILSDSLSEQSAFQWIDQVPFLVKHYTKFFYNTSLPCLVKCRPPLLSTFAVMLVRRIIFHWFCLQ